MNSEQRIETVLELLEGKATVAELSHRHGVAESELLAWRDTWLAGVRAGSRAKAPKRSFKVLGGTAAVALACLVSREAYAASCSAPSLFSNLGLKYFCADDPALADEVNQNTQQLVSLIQQKVGASWGLPDAGVSSVGITTPTATVTGTSTLTGGATVGPTGAMSFGTTTRQMLNLWGTSFGLGVQDNTLYFRTGGNFAWYVNGSHNNGELNPGGGAKVMQYTSAGGVAVRGITERDLNMNNDDYQLQRFTVEASPSMLGVAMYIHQPTLEALCRDDDGCPFTLSMVNYVSGAGTPGGNGDGNVATREGTLFLSQTTRAWRAVFAGTTDVVGVDGAGGNNELSAWDCYFGDAENTDNLNNRNDTAIGFSLLNARGGSYSDADTTCRIVFRD
jgi:transposase-like protein